MIAQLPSEKRPIYIIGAGGIVNDAHLPAYKIAVIMCREFLT